MLRRQHAEEEDVDADGALVRLGEGLMVDFAESVYEMLFCDGLDLNPSKTAAANKLITLPDPDLSRREAEIQARQSNGATLQECLDEFEKEEILAEEDKWYCPRCKEHVRASKKLELWKTPDILVIHLKRFSNSGYRRDKIDMLVNFEVENLDLTKRVVEKSDDKREVYDLIAVDNHWGGLGGGHYTAMAKSFFDHCWYEYNGMRCWKPSHPFSNFLMLTVFLSVDSGVSQVAATDKIVSNSAYLLFYRRQSGVPLGGSRFKEILSRFDNPESDEEISVDSGEIQRLVDGSSPHRPSSGFMGSGVTLRQEGRCLASDSSLLGHSPSSLQFRTFPSIDQSADLALNSVEQDEGVEVDYPFPNHHQTWRFQPITAEDMQNADDDASSTRAVGSDSSVFEADESRTHFDPVPAYEMTSAWNSDMDSGARGHNAVSVILPEPAEETPATEIHLSDAEDDSAAPAPTTLTSRGSGPN